VIPHEIEAWDRETDERNRKRHIDAHGINLLALLSPIANRRKHPSPASFRSAPADDGMLVPVKG
jgi:hypothetical protein